MAASRRMLLAAGAVAAVGAGAAASWWRHRSSPAEAVPPMWHLNFDQPGGGQLAMQSLRGKPLVINFWATWCPPCIKELPQLERFQTEFAPKGWQVLALAIDREQAVREFLTKIPLKLTVALGGLDGVELGRALGNDQGGLPFSVVLDAAGRITQRKSGQTHFEELAGWARAASA
jgi:thiol-disulfide isomerase/thioredoxin